MDLDQARAFLKANHRAVMTTYKRDGTAQMSPVTAGVDDEGRLVVSSRETAVKVRNLRRDPRVALVVLTEKFFGDWLLVEGTTEIVPLPGAMEELVEYYRRISGEHPDWDDYRAAMIRDQRVILRITMDKVGPTFHG